MFDLPIPCIHVNNLVYIDDKVVLGLQNGRNVSVDRVIVAVGLQPETSLAQKAQLEIDPIRVCTIYFYYSNDYTFIQVVCTWLFL